METEITKFYCICDDSAKELGIKDDKRAKLNDAEILSIAFIAVEFCGGNYEKAKYILSDRTYFKHLLSKSRFNRRLGQIAPELWQKIATKIQKISILQSQKNNFVIDSFPVAVCSKARINRSKIYTDKIYVGYNAIKQEFYRGIKVHCITNDKGEIVEFMFTSASCSDIKAARKMNYFALPKKATIFADKAYNDYKFEDRLKKLGISWKPIRKKKSKRPFGPKTMKRQSKTRKIIETTFSLIHQMLPAAIHAVTSRGFETKVKLFVLAFAMRVF